MMKEYLPVRRSLLKSLIFLLIYILFYLSDNFFSITALIDFGIFSRYVMPLLWVGFVVAIWRLPKMKSAAKLKLRENVTLWAIIFAILYVLINIGAGIMEGLGKSPYSHSITGIFSNIFIIGSALMGREFLRSYLVGNLTPKENFLIFIFLSALLAFCNYPINKYIQLEGTEDTVQFIAQYIAPELSQNLVATYLSFLGGVVPSVVYMGINQAFHWFSPVLPDLKWITMALIGILCPAFFLMSIQNLYMKESRTVSRKEADKEKPAGWIIMSLVSVGLIWFVAGVFPVYPSVIATGSMEPMIYPGDVILVNKSVDRVNLSVGDVIQFKREKILISHRIIEVIKGEGGKEYCTKGDNNSGVDIQNVMPEQIKGVVIQVVPKIGWPTLLIKSRDNIPLDELEF